MQANALQGLESGLAADKWGIGGVCLSDQGQFIHLNKVSFETGSSSLLRSDEQTRIANSKSVL